MKAIVYTQYGPPDVLQLQEVEKPAPKDDEILIGVHAASVNQYDWHLLTADIFLVRLMGGGLLKYLIARLNCWTFLPIASTLPATSHAGSRVFWFEQPPAHQAHQEDIGGQKVPVVLVDGRRMNRYQYFVVLGSGLFYLLELKNVRWSVFGAYDRFHLNSPMTVAWQVREQRQMN